MKYLSYDQVVLVPQYSVVSSRGECSTHAQFLGQTFRMPVVPANMKCSINFELAEELSKNFYPYILHRFEDYNKIYDWIASNQDRFLISISIGVQQKDRDLLKQIADNCLRVDWITVDIAQGHSVLMKGMIQYIKSLRFMRKTKTVCFNPSYGPVTPTTPYKPKVIAGNIATIEAALDLESWGADAVKAGIGQGRTCSTRLKTGFGIPMFSCVRNISHGEWAAELSEGGESLDCFQLKKLNIPIVADGGIKQYGDLSKALVAGATMVMAGSMFSKCLDSPAETFYVGDYNITQGNPWKRWFGSASEENKGDRKHVEGFMVEEKSNGLTYLEMLGEWGEALRSSISYAGGKDLSCFRGVDYVEV